MTSMTSGSRTSRIILILAAVAAAISIGIAAVRMSKSDDVLVANATNEPMAPLAQLENRVKLDQNDVEGWQLLGWSYFNMARYGEAADA